MTQAGKGHGDNAYYRHVRTKVLPMVEGSRIGISIVPTNPEDVDVKFATELGLMMMLDKPILLVCHPDTLLPEKMRKVADEIVWGLPDDPDYNERIFKALQRMGIDKT